MECFPLNQFFSEKNYHLGVFAKLLECSQSVHQNFILFHRDRSQLQVFYQSLSHPIQSTA